MATRVVWASLFLAFLLSLPAAAQRSDEPGPTPAPQPTPQPTPAPPPTPPPAEIPSPSQDQSNSARFRKDPRLDKEMREFARQWMLDGIRAAELSPALSSPVARDAIAQFEAGEIVPAVDTWVTTGLTFTTPESTVDETPYVSVSLYQEGDDGLVPDDLVTFFGVVVDAAGSPVGAFEDETTVASNGGHGAYVSRSFMVDPGSYELILGILKDGHAVVMTRTNVDVASVGQADEWASDLLLTRNVSRYATLYPSTAPFHFGDVLVVPEGDLTFDRSDEMWFFVEVRNAIARTDLQKFRIETRVSGNTASGTHRFASPMSEIEGKALCNPFDQTLKHKRFEQAERGCERARSYLLGQAVPLASFDPGEYEIEVKIVEDNSGASYVRNARFKVEK